MANDSHNWYKLACAGNSVGQRAARMNVTSSWPVDRRGSGWVARAAGVREATVSLGVRKPEPGKVLLERVCRSGRRP